ncbi:MAG: biotin--[acetyl-CoA-carboxylase] ligase [Agathobacter sp.]|nr:biotin--[acetyl-CoA-carboxylase] ligase [Agathobacter sp.]
MITKRYHFETIDSTNKRAKELAAEGTVHGTLVTADAQVAGVGRRGRSWSSEKDAGIYMSMVLRPEIETDKASMLTLIAALAVQKAIQKVCGEKVEALPMIKWPNDVVLNKKKICGILTEMSLKGTAIEYVIVGIGINVNNKAFPEEIVQTASSLSRECGEDIEREMLITEVWKQFSVYYEQFITVKDLSFLKEEYERALINKEEKVKVLDPLGEYVGIAKGITNTGELIVDTEEDTRLVSGGEVSVRGIYGYV